RSVDHAPQIDREYALPVLQRSKTVAVGADAGIVHQDIGAAEPLLHRGLQPLDVIEAADVDGSGHDIGGAAFRGGRQRSGGCGEALIADIGNADLHAEAGKPRCGGEPDAGGASSDDGNIVRRHGGMGQSNSPDRSGSPALYRLVRHTPSFSCACGTATAKQGAGRKLAYLAISQTVAGTRAPRRASLADTPFHHAWSAARSQCSLT